jgi:3-hydroxyisobutyrate dehydrogenase-like beta-hydroxyacid dehydrogenase
MDDSPIGLIGVGLLGSALAERMVGGRLAVLGFDPAPGCKLRLEAMGGTMALGAGEVLERCELVVVCLPSSAIVRKVVEENQAALRAGQLVVDATTGDPADTEALTSRLAACGVGYVAASVVGSSRQVQDGRCVVIAGGGAADRERAGAVLDTWSGQRFAVLGLNRAVLAEGLSLAEACGVDAALALEILKATPAYSAVMDSKGLKMIARDYEPQARVSQHLKDVRLIRALAARQNGTTPLSDLHEQLLMRVCDMGFAEADNSAIFEAFRGDGAAPGQAPARRARLSEAE